MIKEFTVDVTARIPTEPYAYVEIRASVTAQVADGETLEHAKQEAEEHLSELMKTQAAATLDGLGGKITDVWIKRLRLNFGPSRVKPTPAPTPPAPNAFADYAGKERATRLGGNATRRFTMAGDDFPMDGHPDNYGDK